MPKRIQPLVCLSACVVALAVLPSGALAGHPSRAPSVSTGAASSVGSSSATVNGSVNPNGSSTTYHVQYGTSTSYGSSSSNLSLPAGTSSVSVQTTLSGLAAGTTYHYRLVATNAYGTTNGGDISFTTVSASSSPSAPSSNYDSAILADRPVAFWDMSNPLGTESDLSGNGHAGAYKGGAPSLTLLPNGDEAVDFNGSSEYMTVPSSAAFSIPTTKQLTWEAWIRPDVLQWSAASDPTGQGYVAWMGKCQNYSPSCEWEARMYASVNSENRCNRLSAYVFNPGAGLGSGSDWQPTCNLLEAGQWLHVVGEYQTQTTPSACGSAYPGTINIWVNGVAWNAADHYPTGCMSQYSISPKAGSSPLDIGTMALDSWFPGAVGKVAIYNYLLTQAQISAHFTAMTGAQPSGSCAATCTTAVPTP